MIAAVNSLFQKLLQFLTSVGDAIYFLGSILKVIVRGRVRWPSVLTQMYEQGVQSIIIIILTSLASGMVLGLQGVVTLQRFGAKEFIARLVALSLVRELSPVFSSLIFSGKAGAGMTAELGTMNTQDQIQATRAMGVDPIELLVVPRFLACILVMPALIIISEIVGIGGGYLIAVNEGHLQGSFYLREVVKAVGFVDFFSGYVKAFFFSVTIAWVCCYQGFYTKGGAMGVGKYTTKAVAYSYILIIVSNAILTKIILTFWG